MGIKFYLEKRIDKAGDAPIRFSATIKGIRYISTVGYSINPKKRDLKCQEVKIGQANSKGITSSNINQRLRDISTFFEKYKNIDFNTETIICFNN